MVIDAEGVEDIEQSGDEGKELQGERVTALHTTGAGPATLHGVLSFGSDPAVSPVFSVCPRHQPLAPSSLKLSIRAS